ncbi:MULTISPECIES: Crp/Fnr family transcriptional regulator [Anaerolinea]|uniref:Crp family transcriptional regulator n=1 Tax=Anaerolinea thermophila (strain DSM 14523 / JCM 11388 / NBRC 100420 / UNI-1) TaxID=926569 RepID=E8N0S7_ANATU|nr:MULTISPECIES: Crp/Fnr family transcriptional regulator [Anaerolinea]BAJ62472.1 Crp family transcriptional regulator [Anaerolinea thermophila UNI-1]
MGLRELTSGLESVRLFRGLTPQQLEWVAARAYSRTFPPGVELIVAGTPGETVYFILSGTVKIYVPQVDGTEVIVNILGPGDTVGELGVIDGGERSASVVTLERTETIWMTGEMFQEALRTIPQMNENLLRILSARVRLTTENVQAYASLDIPGRIARQLLSLAHTYGREQGGGVFIPLRLTQGDIAELVGSSRKRVNQVMVTLRREGVLTFDTEGHITLFRLKDLERMVEGRVGHY